MKQVVFFIFIVLFSPNVFSGENKIKNNIGMEFVYINPGTFMMGSPENEDGRDFDELLHKVILTKGFYIQKTEATQGQWEKIMGKHNNPSNFKKGANYPVEQVSWNDVQNFISKLNQIEHTNKYRLPTEAEWEYCCRSGGTDSFSNNPIAELGCGYEISLDKVGWYCGNSKFSPHPVGKKDPNKWGIYDMHGNVWEWCQDSCDYDKDNNTLVITDTYRDGIVDPIDTFGRARIKRGGAWNNYALNARSAGRRGFIPSNSDFNLGFRLVKDL
ncbi:MAG: formylglycine-generating enzyme family protein [Desulfobacterales bacterium]|nr:formylglycine-generating enzyme family protein [Desulfobacterales bacterium]